MNDPLQIELEKLILKTKELGMMNEAFTTGLPNCYSQIEVLSKEVEEIKKDILENAAWIGDCECVTPEQSIYCLRCQTRGFKKEYKYDYTDIQVRGNRHNP